MRALDRPWFVCQSNPKEEARARYFLEQKGFQVYLPMMEAQRLAGARAVACLKPLFPGYLFVRFDRERELTAVRWTQGVLKILPDSSEPVWVNEDIVQSVRALAQRDGIIRKRPFKTSDRVRILKGPFKELDGIFEEWASDAGRVRILLECVSYQATVELHHTLVDQVA
ncbi:MAG: transcription termination/antitermination NusG family protein [bacterium]